MYSDSKIHTALENVSQFGVVADAKRIHDNDMALHTDQVMYSCGSLVCLNGM